MSFHVPKEYMVPHPVLGLGEGNNGFFTFIRDGLSFAVVASDGGGWEHVSVTLNKRRCPTWEEMCMIKDLFWDPEDVVVQYHPRKTDYISNHPFCLHMWRPVGQEMPCPPKAMVGV